MSVFTRPNCIYNYCPHPEGCTERCVFPASEPKLPAAVSEVDGGTQPFDEAGWQKCVEFWKRLATNYREKLDSLKPVAPQGTVEGEADPDLEKGWLPKVLHRASLEMVIIRWVQDKATDEQLRELRDKLAAARESVAPPSVATHCNCRQMCSCKASEKPHCHYCKAGM